jgi:hypothetical protein
MDRFPRTHIFSVRLPEKPARAPTMFNTTLLIVVGAIVFLALGVWLFFRAKHSREEGYAHFKCPGCRRRLRYKRRQVGHKGECSNCGRGLVFPPISETSD